MKRLIEDARDALVTLETATNPERKHSAAQWLALLARKIEEAARAARDADATATEEVAS